MGDSAAPGVPVVLGRRGTHWAKRGAAGQNLLGPRARGPEEDELALSPGEERVVFRGWVPCRPHQSPAAEAAADRVTPELPFQYSGNTERCGVQIAIHSEQLDN